MRNPELVLLQRDIEILHDKNQLLPRLRSVFREGDDGYFPSLIAENGLDVDFGIELLVQMALHKRCDPETMLGLMRRFFDTAQDTANALMHACDAGLVRWDEQDGRLVVLTEVCSEIQAELDLYQYVPPMVVEPAEVTNNRETGLLSSGGSIILRNNHHDHDVRLEHINRMNRIPMAINMVTANMIQNKWKNLDHRRSDESQQDYIKRVRAFQKFDRVARGVMDALVDMGNRFWLTHRYDKRGRTYCQGYHVTTQGAAWNKAVIELADKELVHQ